MILDDYYQHTCSFCGTRVDAHGRHLCRHQRKQRCLHRHHGCARFRARETTAAGRQLPAMPAPEGWVLLREEARVSPYHQKQERVRERRRLREAYRAAWRAEQERERIVHEDAVARWVAAGRPAGGLIYDDGAGGRVEVAEVRSGFTRPLTLLSINGREHPNHWLAPTRAEVERNMRHYRCQCRGLREELIREFRRERHAAAERRRAA